VKERATMSEPIDRHDALTGVLHDLLRDHVLPGKLEELVRDAEMNPPPYTYTNEHLGTYATHLARRIRAARRRPLAVEAVDALTIDRDVRLLVCWLREHGFATCDSGDGTSKVSLYPSVSDAIQDGVRDEAHVCIRVDPEDLIAETHRLEAQLLGIGIRLVEQNGGRDPFVQATYDPGNRMAMIDLVHLTDDALAAVGVRWPLHDEDPSRRALLDATADAATLLRVMRASNERWDLTNERERRTTEPAR
jgi:hypothetical protein